MLVLNGTTLVILATLVARPALAQPRTDPQQYSSRPIRIILPNTAGSAMDVVTRMMSQRFTESWGQSLRPARALRTISDAKC